MAGALRKTAAGHADKGDSRSTPRYDNNSEKPMNILFVLCLMSQHVTDLGVMTPNRGVILEHATNRSDFISFTIELQAARWPSNYARFQTTNTLLTIADFGAMPPGPCVMSVKSLCADGEESTLSLYRLDIRRDPPKPPKAKLVSTGAKAFSVTLTNALASMKQKQVDYPSIPGQTNITRGQPLPKGKEQTYSEGVVEMQKFFAEHQGARRNE